VITQADPAEPDFDALAESLYVQPQDAYLDEETGQIVPSVTGVSLDAEAAGKRSLNWEAASPRRFPSR
jgi:hypothetical protein